MFWCAAVFTFFTCVSGLLAHAQGIGGNVVFQLPIAGNHAADAQENRTASSSNNFSANLSLQSDSRAESLFGNVNQVDGLSAARRPLALSPGANVTFSAEATGRRTSDVGSLLQTSKSTQGVQVQKRTPIINDTRIRGQRVGQVLASGSFWGPARMDLDSMMSKIDSRLIEDAILVKGPYATRYGPGFRFVDLEFRKSPRYFGGYQSHGSTSMTYNSNGEQFYGRQTIEGGGPDSGYLLSYGHQTGNDYDTGLDGFSIPSSYKSRDIFGAIGFDISDTESIEFNLIRLDQTDVEFPGLVFDLDYLITDGYELTYTNSAPIFADHFEAEVWYNRTRFEGDTLRDGKNVQIPDLRLSLESPTGIDGFGITDGDALSFGYRLISTYETCRGNVAIGTDLNILNQELNDIEPFAPADDNNFPIPRSNSVDVGVFIESTQQIAPRVTRTSGARLDGVFTDARSIVDGVPDTFEDLKESALDQRFLLPSAFVTTDFNVTDNWNITAGVGTAHRAPTLTELYAEQTFIGSLQRGLTFLNGDPQLDSEKLYQIDLGTSFKTKRGSFGINAYHSWINDFITYDLDDPAGTIDGFQLGAELVNTDLATIAGLEAYGQYQISPMLSAFGILSTIEGRDLSRNEPARLVDSIDRSDATGVDKEPLPGINPLETRVGIQLQDPSANPKWGIEFMARIVATQDRIASTLDEIETPGFTTLDLRSYFRVKSMLVTAGVENIGDTFYREHVDYRSGLGVFQPGIGYYLGTEVSY